MTNKTDNVKLIFASIRVGRNAMLKHNFAEVEMIEKLGDALQAAQEEIEQLRNDTKEVVAARIYIRERDAQHVRLHRAETKLANTRELLFGKDDALFEAHKKIKSYEQDYALCNEDRQQMAKKLAAIRDLLESTNYSASENSHNAKVVREALSILNTTNAQPAQEQGGKE